MQESNIGDGKVQKMLKSYQADGPRKVLLKDGLIHFQERPDREPVAVIAMDRGSLDSEELAATGDPPPDDTPIDVT